MQAVNLEELVEQLSTQDMRYGRDAYYFTREALDFTQKLITRENRGTVRQHVTGQELLEGIRQYALQEYGPMTVTVLEEWGIKSCRDFGDIVFNMVESGLLAKTDKDTREDFRQGYDFTEAFRKPYWPEKKLRKSGKPLAK
jgi:uncharacterized repeat protein (TIGR04138 family)